MPADDVPSEAKSALCVGLRPFDQAAEQKFIDTTAKANLAVDLNDWNCRPVQLPQLRIFVDVNLPEFRQILGVSGENFLRIVAEMAFLA